MESSCYRNHHKGESLRRIAIKVGSFFMTVANCLRVIVILSIRWLPKVWLFGTFKTILHAILLMIATTNACCTHIYGLVCWHSQRSNSCQKHWCIQSPIPRGAINLDLYYKIHGFLHNPSYEPLPIITCIPYMNTKASAVFT